MQSKDLRIGNLVRINNALYRQKDNGKTFHILKIDSYGEICSGVCIDDMPCAECFAQFLKYIEPIKLDEKTLLDIGFGEVNKSFYEMFSMQRNNKTTFSFSYTKDLNGDWYVLISEDIKVYIEFVHQFQNLYFALTGQELEFIRNIKP